MLASDNIPFCNMCAYVYFFCVMLGYGVGFEASYGLSHGAKYDADSYAYSSYDSPASYSSSSYSAYNDGYAGAR